MGVKDEEGEDGVWWRIVYRYVKEEEEEEEEEKMSVSGGWRSRQALTCKATVGIPQLLCKRCTQSIDTKFAANIGVREVGSVKAAFATRATSSAGNARSRIGGWTNLRGSEVSSSADIVLLE